LAAARFQPVVLVGLLAAESVAAVELLRLLAEVPILPAVAAPTASRPAGPWAAMREAGGRVHVELWRGLA
jgi:hypothetical protein